MTLLDAPTSTRRNTAFGATSETGDQASARSDGAPISGPAIGEMRLPQHQRRGSAPASDATRRPDANARVRATPKGNGRMGGAQHPSGAQLAWGQFWAILGKDLRTELRTRQVWLSMGVFALLTLLIFSFAFDLQVENTAAVGPGALWVSFIFASMLGLGRNIASEQEHGPMDRLLLCPVDRQVIYLAKVIGNVIFIGVVEVVALPVFAALYNLPILVWAILPITLLGTLGVAAVGVIFAALAANTRAREFLLPLLVFPLIVPIVIGAVKATEALVTPIHGDAPWLGLIAAFDIIFLSLSAVLFHFVVEE